MTIKRPAVASMAIVAVLLVAAAYWTWLGLTQRTITGDDGLSIRAAQGIVEHGYPLLPGGYIYYRTPVPSYLLATSIKAVGLNDLGIMVPSLLMAVGSLFLVFRFGRDILGRPWVGIAAAVFLLVLQAQTFYATSARMYMPLQFFTILAVYCAWRGYIKGEIKFQCASILAVGCAIFTHSQSGALLVAIPLAVLAVWWMQGTARPRVNYAWTLVALVCLGALYFGFEELRSEFPLAIPAEMATGYGGGDPEHAGLRLSIADWLRQAREVEFSVPLGLLLAPAVLFLGYKSFQGRLAAGNQGVLFTMIIFAILAVAVILVVNRLSFRVWVFVLPVYSLVLWSSIFFLAGWLTSRARESLSAELRQRQAVGILSLVWAGIVIVGSSFVPSVYYPGLIRAAYGVPCVAPPSDRVCSREIGAQMRALLPYVADDDIIISTNTSITNYYLGRADGYLRERRIGDGIFTSFDFELEVTKGIPVIDSLDKLREARESERRVWIIADHNIDVFSSQETRDFLDESYIKYDSNGYVTIFVNRIDHITQDIPTP